MPKVIPLGVSYTDFWSLNPHRVDILVLAYNEAKKNEIRAQNMLAYLQGQYFAEALLATVCNMFRSKGQQPYKYPSKPYELNLDLNIDDEEERKIEIKRRDFVTNLNNMFRDIDMTLQERNDGN
jgi:hypothetical protein